MQATIISAAAKQGEAAHAEPLKFRRRIGSTTFVAAVHFSRTSKEKAQDKILRLIEGEVGGRA